MNKFAKPQAKQEPGSELILTFFKDNDDRTIARTNTGKICLLDISYCKENKIYVKENEDWRCIVAIEKEKCIIVQPVTRVVTAEENATIYADSIGMLKDKFQGNRKK